MIEIITKLIDRFFAFYQSIYRLRRRNDPLARLIFNQLCFLFGLLISCITILLLSQVGAWHIPDIGNVINHLYEVKQ